MTICAECGADTAGHDHRIGCSQREVRDNYRARRLVQDPRFKDGKFVGEDRGNPNARPLPPLEVGEPDGTPLRDALQQIANIPDAGCEVRARDMLRIARRALASSSC